MSGLEFVCGGLFLLQAFAVISAGTLCGALVLHDRFDPANPLLLPEKSSPRIVVMGLLNAGTATILIGGVGQLCKWLETSRFVTPHRIWSSWSDVDIAAFMAILVGNVVLRSLIANGFIPCAFPRAGAVGLIWLGWEAILIWLPLILLGSVLSQW
jgi:hypothetical protein